MPSDRRLLPHDQVVCPVRVDPNGVTGPTRKQARGKHWRRTSHGYYVPSHVNDAAAEQRIAEASVLVPDVGGITGWAALRWCGGSWFDGSGHDGPEPITIASGYHDVRPQAGVETCHERIPIERYVTHDGVSVTVPARSALFQMRRARSLTDAVVMADMAAFDDLVSIPELLAQLPEHRTITGVPLARRATLLAAENSWSPIETRLRLRLLAEFGDLAPRCNMPLFDLDGRLLGTPDLFDARLGLAIEYDGDLHLTRSRRRQDLDRELRFRDHGVEVAVVLAEDFHGYARLSRRLSEAIRRAERTVRARRAQWTLEQPAWWRPTHTVRHRRFLAHRGLGHLLPSRRMAA